MSKRIISISSGKEKIQMEVTEEEYQNYYRPWWQQKKKEQRNRDAMERNGYTQESYEEWKDGLAEGQVEGTLQADEVEQIIEKKLLLGILEEALNSLLPEEKELAVKVFGEEMPLIHFANMKNQNSRTLSDHKRKVLGKLRDFFIDKGFNIDKK